MASITSSSGISGLLGQFSGIGAEQIDQLLEAEAIPKVRAQNRIADIQKQKTAWSDVKSRLTNLTKRIAELQKSGTYQSKIATSTDEKSVTISGSAAAMEASYQLKVDQLATSSNLVGSKHSSATESLAVAGSVVLTTSELDEDGTAKQFTFEITENDSLRDVVGKINQETKNSNIQASIVDNRLVLTDKKTGSREFSVSGDAVDGLGLTGPDVKYTEGTDAKFSLNGIEITRQSNTISDVIEGVTFNLIQTTEKEVSLSLSNDNDLLKEAVKDFVAQYNSLNSFIGDKVNVGDPSAENNQAGELSGDTALVRLQTELRNMIVPAYSPGSNTRAFQVGFSLDRYGTLSLDESKLDKMIAEDPEALRDFFYKTDQVDGETKISGYTANLLAVTDKYLSERSDNKGVIATKFETYEANIKDLNRQVERIDEIIESRKARYISMFTRLDQAMMKAEEQMGFLINQINSFNGGN